MMYLRFVRKLKPFSCFHSRELAHDHAPLSEELQNVALSMCNMSLICDKSVTTQYLAFYELLVWKETFADALLTGIVS